MSRTKKSVHRRLRRRNRRNRGHQRGENQPNVGTTRSDIIRTTARREIILTPDTYYAGRGGESDWIKKLKWWSSAIMKICAIMSSFASSLSGPSAVPVGCSKVLPIVPSDFIVGTPYKHSFAGLDERRAWFYTNFSTCRLMKLRVVVTPAVANSEIRGEVVVAVFDTQKMEDGPYQEIKLVGNMSFEQIVQNFRSKRMNLTPNSRLTYVWRPRSGSNAGKIQTIGITTSAADVYNIGHCCTFVISYRNISSSSAPSVSSFTPSNAQLRVQFFADLELATPTELPRKVSCYFYHQNVQQVYTIESFGKCIDVPKDKVTVRSDGTFEIDRSVEGFEACIDPGENDAQEETDSMVMI